MEPFKLKLKVGVHEFEAEGEQETVERQLAVWREMIGSMPISPPVAASPPPPAAYPQVVQLQPAGGIPSRESFGLPSLQVQGQVQVSDSISRGELDRLFDHRGPVVTLTMIPSTDQREADAALLLLLGQREYNAVDLVTGSRLQEGLRLSGLSIPRIDRSWGSHMDTNVLRVGSHRGVKYRLTNPGLARARELARELIGRLA